MHACHVFGISRDIQQPDAVSAEAVDHLYAVIEKLGVSVVLELW